MGVYISAMLNCFETLKVKQLNKYKRCLNFKDFDYMCFHTPFAKMVQKSFLSLIEYEISKVPADFRPDLVKAVDAIKSDAGSAAEKTTKV
jgi:hydroxymethylglutaryl-CoA synthase